MKVKVTVTAEEVDEELLELLKEALGRRFEVKVKGSSMTIDISEGESKEVEQAFSDLKKGFVESLRMWKKV